MTEPLLETKLYLPKLRPDVVARPRLSERLRRGAESKLTLISAPAGFGKTTLLTEWLAATPERAVAWLSLDQKDSRPATFWTYLITALQTVVPGVGATALPLLQSADAPIEPVLTIVINELGAVPHDVAVVLDDYHVVESPDIEEGMIFLLEHLPSQVHIVIATRADPRLPLARLRARGELVEIRAADLRFSHDEAATYLNAVVGLDLTAANVALLGERTEGWIAALQLAGLSMQGRSDVGGFIAGFAGNDRYIVDYLVDEVLQRQPDHVRTFLLSTSILERLNGALCDAVTQRHDSKAMLETLEHGNLFVVPLDDIREWYRYHRLFADVLQAHLLESRPDEIAALHVRASAWYQQDGDTSEAIRHAMAGQDFDRAADLVELAIPVMRRIRQEATLHGWLKALPADVIRVRPVLSVGLAGALLSVGEFEGVEARLQDAEGLLQGNGVGPANRPAEIVVANEEEFQRLPAAIALYRAAGALAHGDVPATVAHAQLVLDLSPEDDHLPRAAAAGLLGIAYWITGDSRLEAGHQAWAECVAGLYRAGHIADTFGCSIGMADIRRVQGRLGDAMRTYEQALAHAGAHGGPTLRGTADMYVGMSEICRERDDLPAALEHLRHSQELGEHLGLPQNPYRWRVAMAGVREAEGDLSGALELLNDAERVYRGDFFPNVRPIPAVRARLWVTQGSLEQALAWAREQGLSATDDLSYMREFEHVTLARVLLAQHTKTRDVAALQSAIGLLQRLLEAAEEGGRTGTVIEILVLQALGAGAVSDGLVPLERALTLAESQGYVRIFVDEGPPMALLLRAAAKDGIARSYVRRLLAALAKTETDRPIDQGLIEPLSERELDVLRLLATDLNGPEIARSLVVSLNTVRTHTKNIYTKLDVNDRRAAVRRAGELDLLPKH
ncbi:MAG TPA: LuxR C-terminal-related transcriptional regulator [Acidothermaceae bacterium]